MTEMFSTLGTWNWLIFGVVLMALELLAPGVFLFWLGLAALNYFIADKYIKAFGQLADSPNQKIIMLPIEAMSILGSLAGIGEIAKATFGESALSAQAAARRASVPSAGSGTVPPVPPPS